MWCTPLPCPVDLAGTLDEGIDESVRDVVEHRPEHLLQQLARELVAQLELDLARRVAERGEAPEAIEMGEGPIGQAQLHLLRVALGVLGAEVRLDAVVVDVQRRRGDRLGTLDQFGAAAPGQEQRVLLAAIDELEHLLGGELYQDELIDFGHGQGRGRHHHDGTEVRPNC